jgi:hypothetical protein
VWECITTYGIEGRREEGEGGGEVSRGLNLKIQPSVENHFLAYLLVDYIALSVCLIFKEVEG